MSIAMRDPMAYVNYLLDLYTAYDLVQRMGGTGTQPTARLGGMNVNLDAGVLGTSAGSLPGGNITQTDWMSMGSIRSATTASTPQPVNPQVAQVASALYTPNGVRAAFAAAGNNSQVLQDALMYIKKQLVSRGSTLQSMGSQMPPGPVGSPQQLIFDLERKIGEGAMPSEVAGWFTQYGATNVVQQADPFTFNKGAGDLQAANNLLNIANGQMVMVNIDSRVISGQHFAIGPLPDVTKSHWVLMKTPLAQSNIQGN